MLLIVCGFFCALVSREWSVFPRLLFEFLQDWLLRDETLAEIQIRKVFTGEEIGRSLDYLFNRWLNLELWLGGAGHLWTHVREREHVRSNRTVWKVSEHKTSRTAISYSVD